MVNISALTLLIGLSLLATVAWFVSEWQGWSFPWEPVVVLLGSLATFVYAKKDRDEPEKSSETHSNQLSTHDSDLFARLTELIPSVEIIEFLRHHDFLQDFELDRLRPLRDFMCDWDNAEHEFQNEELEAKKQALMEQSASFNILVAKYTCPNRCGRQAVRVDNLKHQAEHEERFRREANELNQSASELVDTHQDLVRTGIALQNQ